MAIEDELYQEIILEHYRAREHRGVLDGATASERGENPSCGDTLTLFVREEPGEGGGVLGALSYEGNGCAICCASAHMLCKFLTGDNWQGAGALYNQVHALLTEGTAERFSGEREDLEAIGGVRKFPTRIKCALLPWSALRVMLSKRENEQGKDEPSENGRD